MKYHDWHLSGYSVRDYGMRIVLHLSWNYPNQERRQNHIQFSDVAAYHFTHGDGAIITFIEEWPIRDFAEKESSFIQYTATEIGLRYWRRDMSLYAEHLEKEGFRYWTIDSAVGFSGFIIAKKAEETTEPNQSLQTTIMAVTDAAAQPPRQP